MNPEEVPAKNPVETAYQIGLAQKPIAVGDGKVPHVLVPQGMTLQPIREYTERQPLTPYIDRQVKMFDLPSFVAYVNRFKNQSSLIGVSDLALRAELDYHAPGQSARNLHSVMYDLAASEEYQAWSTINNKPQAQQDFALFLEERAGDVVQPASAAMLEIVLTLTANTTIEFKSGKRLDNLTQQLQYVETQQARAGQQGNLEIPTGITLSLPLFRHGEPVLIEAKLRTIIRDGKAMFVVKLLGLDRARDDALAKMIEQVATETALPVWRGVL
jgi:uncharacterized protein YfdQ (DUF2303 family)